MSKRRLLCIGLASASGSVRPCTPRLYLSRRWTGAVSSRTLSQTTFQSLDYDQKAVDTNASPEISPLSISSHTRDFNEQPSAVAFASHASCPGCGALAQTVDTEEPGYYNVRRRVVSNYLSSNPKTHIQSEEDQVYQTAMDRATPDLLKTLGSSKPDAVLQAEQKVDMPLCNRCHDLLHHHRGASIHHPSLESLEQTIAESPFKHNHIYHVLDAADFPMSLVPNIQRILDVSPQRSKNRRAKHASWKHGRKTELSFIITRSDLLAPKKSQVDHLMPYLVEVLREALGRAGRNVRLGNVHCVSSKRGWWTREVKEDIWKRGGAGWMLGKVNVGKSNLFELVFPRNRTQDVNFDALRSAARTVQRHEIDQDKEQLWDKEQLVDKDEIVEDDESLLPAAREEVPFPIMPTVSSLPGTTASPIRIPFGGGKGELIDLPGLARGDLDTFVRPEHRDSLVMKTRVSPDQYTIKPGQSLLLGGLVRITPVDQETVILAYPFVPIKPHLTSTQKIHEMATGVKAPVDSVISEERVLSDLKSAGKFALEYDVTKARAGPLTTRSAANLKQDNLPFKVMSVDILIESLGWVELVTQVRKRRFDSSSTSEDEDYNFPEVEVFSPTGSFIGSRRPMQAWLLSNKAPQPVSARKKRPRRSMTSSRAS